MSRTAAMDFAATHPTYRVADLTNPILQPWVIAQMKRDNDEVLAGKIPFMARERCYPGGVPEWDIFRRVAPPMVFFVQTPKEVLMIWRGDNQVRHVYMNVPHSAHPKPSWYGESVGHYEGDTLVVDTIGQNTKTFVDNYRTPHTDQLHVVERFRMTDGGKTMEVNIHVEDPGAFTTPWNAVQRYARFEGAPRNDGRLVESICAESASLGHSTSAITAPAIRRSWRRSRTPITRTSGNRSDQKRTADYRPAEGRVAAPAFRLRSTVPPTLDATACSAAFLFAAWARLLVFFFALTSLPPMARSPICDLLEHRKHFAPGKDSPARRLLAGPWRAGLLSAAFSQDKQCLA